VGSKLADISASTAAEIEAAEQEELMVQLLDKLERMELVSSISSGSLLLLELLLGDKLLFSSVGVVVVDVIGVELELVNTG
jgi:hypothetical protein